MVLFLPGNRVGIGEIDLDIAGRYHRQRAEKKCAREVQLEKDTAKAAENWNIKPLPESTQR